MPDPTNTDVMEAVKALRKEVESKSVNPEKIDHLQSVLDGQETKNQELIRDLKTAQNALDDQKERMDALETELARAGGAGDQKSYRDTPEYKALEGWVRDGAITSERKELLRTDSDTAGGFLTNVELDNAITKQITEISMVRSVARVRTIGSKAMSMPIRQGIPTAAYEGEAETGGDSTSVYGSETLNTFRQTFTSPITMDMLMDSAFSMESEIMGDAGEAFAQGEGRNFVIGDGFKKPQGFTADPRVQTNARPTTSSGTITGDDVILLTGDLKVGYSPMYAFNRRTLAFLRTLKGSDGQYLWQPGLNGVVASTINGFPYIIMEDMPDIASNAYSIAFADFRRGYTIVDRAGLSIVRDEYTRKKEGIIEFTMNRYNYGQVTLPEAIKLLQVA